jgi:hypothetical protein
MLTGNSIDVIPASVIPLMVPERPTLHDLQRTVVREHEAAGASAVSAIAHAAAAGMALLKMKVIVGHGDWMARELELSRTEKISTRTLREYMQIAKAVNNGKLDIGDAVANLSYREVLARIKKPRASKASVTTTTVTTTSVKTAMGYSETSTKTMLARNQTILYDRDRVETAFLGFNTVLGEVAPMVRQKFLKDFSEVQPWRGTSR